MIGQETRKQFEKMMRHKDWPTAPDDEKIDALRKERTAIAKEARELMKQKYPELRASTNARSGNLLRHRCSKER